MFHAFSCRCRDGRGLHEVLYDVGFSLTDEVGEGIFARPLWGEPLMAVVPERHPLLAYRQIAKVVWMGLTMAFAFLNHPESDWIQRADRHARCTPDDAGTKE